MRRVYDLSLSVLAVAALWAAGASAQEVPCTAADGLRCTWGFPPALIQPAGLQFDLQARVSQAGLQVPDGTLPSVLVNVLRGREVVCQEALSNVPVRQSVLNLSVGAGASCKLDEVTAKSADLALQVCLGPGNCLKPLPVGSSPYAYNARYASIVQRARRANTASHARWTRWITADRSLWVRPELATGAFDLSTPEPNDARNLYGPDAFSAFANAGFFTWSPLADPNALHLHFSGKGVRSDRLSSLDELVFLANTASLTGALRVTPALTGQGLRVTLGDALISGHTTLDGALLSAGAVTSAAGDLTVTGGMDVAGDTRFGGSLSVATGLTAGGGWDLAGDLVLTGALELDGSLVIGSGGAQIAQDAATGGIAIGLDTDVTGDLVVHGTTTFKAFAQLEAGSSSVGAQADARYVSAGDTRAVTFGGATTLAGAVTVGTGLDLASQAVTGLELPTAAAALPTCDAGNQGAFMVNGPSVEFCIDGTWRRAVAAACGDGRVTGKETCDDKNKTAGDGCSDKCLVEPGWVCNAAQPTTCTKPCGDGKIDFGEQCDDGAKVAGDGCDGACQVEVHPVYGAWFCGGTPSSCRLCGNSILEPGENCEDGAVPWASPRLCRPGCTSGPFPPYHDCYQSCGYSANGTSPCISTCPYYGNGKVEHAEQCDDGNSAGGDGCTNNGHVESGWMCTHREGIGCDYSHCQRWTGHACNLWVKACGYTLQGCQSRVYWGDANLACQNSGNHLVTIGSASEEAVVQEVVDWHSWMGTGAMWIGASWYSAWTWQNGEPFTYWNPGTPIQFGTCYSKAMGNVWGYYSSNCSSQFGFICEKGP